MKKPIIKNWIKYFTVTLAVSGMLAVGGCDSNTSDQQEADYTTEVEATENEVAQPTRDNVSQEIETDTYDTEDEPAQPAATEGQDATATDTEAANNQQAQQYDQTSNQSSAPRAQGINNIDNHLEEHSEANREITEALTDAENLEEGEAAGIHQGTTTSGQGTTTTANQYEDTDRNTYDRQSNTGMEQEGDMNQQGTMDGPTQQENSLDNEQDANIGRQGTTTQGVPQEEGTYQGQDAEVEVDTDRQGTTEMEIDRQEDTNVRQEENAMDQQQSMGTGTDQEGVQQQDADTTVYVNPDEVQHNAEAPRDAPRYENDGDDPTRAGINEQRRESDYGNQAQGQNTQTNIGAEPNEVYEQGETENQTQTDTNMNQQEQQSNQQGNNQQGVQQGDDGTGVIVYERYSITYPESYSDEDRQRTEDIMSEYETRRESMRGQMNEETGAYMSPEVDAEPREGYDQLMRQISENIEYPQNAAAAELEGTVFVNFVVDENGNIEEAKAVDDVIVPLSSMEYATNPLDPTKFNEEEIEQAREEMREEAVKAVEATSGQWQAGQQGGENVKSELQIPVRFSIEDVHGTGNTIDNR